MPYSIELLGIANEFYQGTETPFNFESDVLIKMDGNDTRRALVYMNTPLRHEGKTFYQYQMNKAKLHENAELLDSIARQTEPLSPSTPTPAIVGDAALTQAVSEVSTPIKSRKVNKAMKLLGLGSYVKQD